MNLIEAHIDEVGIDRVRIIGENQGSIDEVVNIKGQLYIPGISVPDVEGLDYVFNVPIIGEYAPFEFSTTNLDGVPTDVDSPDFYKVVQFAGLIPDEAITIGAPVEAPEYIEPTDDETELNEKFDDLIHSNGILYVSIGFQSVEYPSTGMIYDELHGSAELLILENDQELEEFLHQVKTLRSMIGVVNGMRQMILSH